MFQNCLIKLGIPLRIQGNIIEAHLPHTFIGEICQIQKSLSEPESIGLAQVIGFNDDVTILSLLKDNIGFSRENILVPMRKFFEINVNDNLKGVIVDSLGTIKGYFDDRNLTSNVEMIDKNSQRVAIDSTPMDFESRKPINEIFITGIKAIDALLTTGIGQRVGIFAAAGCGKTSLMRMLIERSEADIYVIGLIGERGREVAELIEEIKTSPRKEQVILVYSTSDKSAIERCNAAKITTTIAEYHSRQGKNVLLFIDSLTRYARALRDIALGAGELPARKGYPASVFESLPKLLERVGNFQNGAITAFYTVLLESEDENDAIGDEVRSILDGHIYLSKNLANKMHYPAIDILNSLSRIQPQIVTPDHVLAASCFVDFMSRLRDMQLMLDLGEYQHGENLENDEALDKKEAIYDYLKQGMDEKVSFTSTLEQLYEITD